MDSSDLAAQWAAKYVVCQIGVSGATAPPHGGVGQTLTCDKIALYCERNFGALMMRKVALIVVRLGVNNIKFHLTCATCPSTTVKGVFNDCLDLCKELSEYFDCPCLYLGPGATPTFPSGDCDDYLDTPIESMGNVPPKCISERIDLMIGHLIRATQEACDGSFQYLPDKPYGFGAFCLNYEFDYAVTSSGTGHFNLPSYRQDFGQLVNAINILLIRYAGLPEAEARFIKNPGHGPIWGLETFLSGDFKVNRSTISYLSPGELAKGTSLSKIWHMKQALHLCPADRTVMKGARPVLYSQRPGGFPFGTFVLVDIRDESWYGMIVSSRHATHSIVMDDQECIYTVPHDVVKSVAPGIMTFSHNDAARNLLFFRRIANEYYAKEKAKEEERRSLLDASGSVAQKSPDSQGQVAPEKMETDQEPKSPDFHVEKEEEDGEL
jgi:hypothetical protein